jgi:hypothetical protein
MSKPKKSWTESKPPKLTQIVSRYGLKSGEMLRALEEFNKPSFADSSPEVKQSLELTEYLTQLGKIGTDAYAFEKHAGWGRKYPGTPMIDMSFKLSAGEKEALLKFKAKKPFKASKQEWLDMLQELFIDLAKVQGHIPPAVMHTGVWKSKKGYTSFYTTHVIVLTGKRSVITALHEYTHSIGYGEVMAVRWSTNAFRIIFPKAFKKLEQHPDYPHLMRRKRKKKVKQSDTVSTSQAEIVETDLGN